MPLVGIRTCFLATFAYCELNVNHICRSEIDRLTALLHSRTVDIPIENQEKRSEVVPSMPVVSHDRKEEFLKTPVQDKNGIESRLVSDPVVNTSV